MQTQKPIGQEVGPHTCSSHPILRISLEQPNAKICCLGCTSKGAKWLLSRDFQEYHGVKIINTFQSACSFLQWGCTDFPGWKLEAGSLLCLSIHRKRPRGLGIQGVEGI